MVDIHDFMKELQKKNGDSPVCSTMRMTICEMIKN